MTIIDELRQERINGITHRILSTKQFEQLRQELINGNYQLKPTTTLDALLVIMPTLVGMSIEVKD